MLFPHANMRLLATRGGVHRGGRSAFTLFEVILAIGLATVLVMLIGTAVNLYLRRIEARRNDVEWAQLARQIFTMIGEDVRAASEYRPQDLSGAIAAVSGSTTNVSSIIGASGSTGAGGTGSGGQQGGTTSASAFGGSTTSGSGSATSAGGSSSMMTSGSSTSTGSSATATGAVGTAMASSLLTTPGVHGTLSEIIIDTSRPPRIDDMFRFRTGYVNAVAIPNEMPAGRQMMTRSPTAIAAMQAPQSDLKTVRYYVRQGNAIDPDSIDATSLSPDAQYAGTGLVRQEVDRAKRIWAEQTGDTTLLEMGEVLIAPEVVALEIRYFDGTTVLDTWEMQSMGLLPIAVEIRLWLAEPEVVGSAEPVRPGTAAIPENAHEFRQTIFLPTSRPPTTTATGTGTTGSTTTGASATSTGT